MSTSHKRILCIECYEDTCELITLHLKDCKVFSVHSEAEALHLATSEEFDLFSLDYYLPDGTGVEVCIFIRAFDKTTPIIFVTNEVSITEEQIVALGAQSLVKKGINYSVDLVETISKHLRK